MPTNQQYDIKQNFNYIINRLFTPKLSTVDLTEPKKETPNYNPYWNPESKQAWLESEEFIKHLQN